MDKDSDKIEQDDVILEEEIVSDEAELEDATAPVKSLQKIKKLRDKLKATEGEKKEFHEELQRSKADFLNSKRRLEEQFAKDKERASDKILIELLSLADSFELAKADEEMWDAKEEKWKDGVGAIYSKLISILSQHDTVPIDPLGESFDPEEHEAISNVEVTDEEQIDKIVTVVQKGYKRKDKIIRPARVIVGTE